jgi:GT2 family glycosyltransferase
MPPPSPPDEVRRLLGERAEARAERDWSRADELRDRIAALGWEVQDSAGRSTVRPQLPDTPAATGYADPADLASVLDEPATVAASVQVVADDHGDDLRRALRGLASHPPSVVWELVVVANAPTFALDDILADDMPVAPVVLRADRRLGWAEARTLGLRRSRGEVTIMLDTSLEPTGDFVTPLLTAFDDPAVGIAGPWGVTSPDARHFSEAPPGDVDAIEAYCLAVRREPLRSVGGFDRRFRFYRNADLDFSFAVRDRGWRAVATGPLALERHEHRGWTSLPEAERDRLSKRNFYRFLEHWGDRPDLLVRPGGR